MIKRLSFVAVAVMIALSAFALSSQGQPQSDDDIGWNPPATVVAFTGSYSSITARELHRIIDQEDWHELWLRQAGDDVERDSYGEPVVPTIDFDRFMVIALFNGEAWNTRRMMLLETRDAEKLHIRFDAGTYQTASLDVAEPIIMEGDVTPEKLAEMMKYEIEMQDIEREATKHEDPNYTNAYGMFVLPRSDKPVVLIENVQGLIGEPPIWEEKQRFEKVSD